MTPHELYDLFRDEMSDVEEPYLWSDDLVYSYMEDAQRMLCRWTEGIADASTAEITELALVDGTTWLDLDPRILRIRTATKSDGCDVEILNFEDLKPRGWRFDGSTGPVRALVIGMEANRVRVFPDCDTAETVSLTVFRLPLDPVDDGCDELEVDEHHHRHLMLWMKACAYGKQDAETFDRTKKREFEAEFRAYCDAAKGEQGRARFKVRTVAYGGI